MMVAMVFMEMKSVNSHGSNGAVADDKNNGDRSQLFSVAQFPVLQICNIIFQFAASYFKSCRFPISSQFISRFPTHVEISDPEKCLIQRPDIDPRSSA